MTSPESSEAVNGKIDMGTRKLKAAYVENATTLYAYLEADFHVLKEYMDTFSEVYKTSSEIDDKIIEGEIYLIYSDKDKCAARARIEQPKAGPAGTKVNFKLIYTSYINDFFLTKMLYFSFCFHKNTMSSVFGLTVCLNFMYLDLVN